MSLVLDIVLCLSGLALCFCLYMLYRNEQVARWQHRCIKLAHDANMRDIYRGIEFDIEWRYTQLPEYDWMMREWWRQCESFLDETRLTAPFEELVDQPR